jgi:hypothetical protein
MSTRHREGAPVPTGTVDGPLYDRIEVQLTGYDGNGFFIAARARTAIRKGLIHEYGWSRDAAEVEAKRYFDEALSGSFDALVQTTMRWVTVL